MQNCKKGPRCSAAPKCSGEDGCAVLHFCAPPVWLHRAFAANFKCTFDLNENNSGSTEFCNFKIEDENVLTFSQNMMGSLKIVDDLEYRAEIHLGLPVNIRPRFIHLSMPILTPPRCGTHGVLTTIASHCLIKFRCDFP